jgi:hypothetical protein
MTWYATGLRDGYSGTHGIIESMRLFKKAMEISEAKLSILSSFFYSHRFPENTLLLKVFE